LPLSELDQIRPLWMELHKHYAAIGEAAGVGVSRTPDESWRRQRAKYERLSDDEAILLVARMTARRATRIRLRLFPDRIDYVEDPQKSG
jgi:hypothetical protein